VEKERKKINYEQISFSSQFVYFHTNIYYKFGRIEIGKCIYIFDEKLDDCVDICEYWICTYGRALMETTAMAATRRTVAKEFIFMCRREMRFE
jgi:hypothetical protein